MKLRILLFCCLLSTVIGWAGDGIPPRGSAEDYKAHEVSGKVAVGAAYVTPAQVRKLFGEDLDKKGYVAFEVGMFPIGDVEVSVSPDDFKLRQGPDGAITRAATPHMVAGDAYPAAKPDTQLPGHIYTTQTVDVVTGSNGKTAVYTGTTVSNRPPPAPPPSPTSPSNSGALEQRLDEKSLPDVVTKRAVAGYVLFPKPTGDKHADYELMYFGLDGQISLKLSPAK